LPTRARLRDPASLFAALGDETRLRLVSRLSSSGPASIRRLTDGSGVTRQAITKHLRVLAGAGLVRATRRGRESVWRLQPERLDEVQRSLDLIARQWDHALGKLKAYVESPLAGGDAETRATRPRAAGQRRAPDRSD
jgi:DNA-binding transcriptional ArsR family regulator